MSRTVCGICWCPYDDDTGACACEPELKAQHMTDLRTAAQQALEALGSSLYPQPRQMTAIAALRAALTEDAMQKFTDVNQELEAALAEPVQEPVAWRWGYRSVTTGEMDWRGYVEIAADPNLRSPAIIMQPLYTAPPQRKPLTEEEILSLFRTSGSPTAFARAIERAHGIT